MSITERKESTPPIPPTPPSPLLIPSGEILTQTKKIWRTVRGRAIKLQSLSSTLRVSREHCCVFRITFINRFHFIGHNDSECNEYCSPENVSNPALWAAEPGGGVRFIWNSSISESNNSFLHGLGHIVSSMPRVWNQTVINVNCVIRNELLLAGKLAHENAMSHH